MKLAALFLLLAAVISFSFNLLVVSPSVAASEEDLYNEIIFLRGVEIGAGGRALALGGAYRALSDDLSALYWNPAGLASIRRLEMTLGISQAQILDDATISNQVVSNQLSRTRLNEVGLVFPVPTYRGSLVFALGYHQVQGFDTFGTFEEESEGTTFTADELESGRLALWSLGMGIDISQTVSTGLALRVWTGYDDYSYHARWEDGDDSYEFDQSLDLKLRGFNVITGVTLRPNDWLRFGATLETPLSIKIEESYAEEDDAGTYSSTYEYKIARSFRAGLGAATLLGPVILTADATFNDWSQIEYREEPAYIELSKDEANRDIARRLKTTIDLHGGAEIWIPNTPVRVQGGYAYLPSPFKDSEVTTDKHVLNGGISTLLDQALLVQTTLTWTGWERSIGGWGEDLQFTHLLITLSYRF